MNENKVQVGSLAVFEKKTDLHKNCVSEAIINPPHFIERKAARKEDGSICELERRRKPKFKTEGRKEDPGKIKYALKKKMRRNCTWMENRFSRRRCVQRIRAERAQIALGMEKNE